MNNHSILIVRRDNIGDLLCTTPMIAELRRLYPEARIDILVNSYNAPVLEGNPHLDHVFAYTKAKHGGSHRSRWVLYWEKLKLFLNLRQYRYNMLFLPGGQGEKQRRSLSFWLGIRDVRLEQPAKQLSGLHEVERCWSILGEDASNRKPGPMFLQPQEVVKNQLLETRLLPLGFKTDRPTMAIHISARKVAQRWPAHLFIALIRQLAVKDPSMQFMLFWSPGAQNNPLHPGDDEKAKEIMAAVDDLPVFPCETGELKALIAGLSCCEFLVCSDGGGMHIGAALGLKIVCLFGNSDTTRWHPWGGPFQLIHAPDEDVTNVSVEEVLTALSRLPINP